MIDAGVVGKDDGARVPVGGHSLDELDDRLSVLAAHEPVVLAPQEVAAVKRGQCEKRASRSLYPNSCNASIRCRCVITSGSPRGLRFEIGHGRKEVQNPESRIPNERCAESDRRRRAAFAALKCACVTMCPVSFLRPTSGARIST